MDTIKISTQYSKTLRIKRKPFVIFLRTPQQVEIWGEGIPFHFNIQNNENEYVFSYTEELIWNELKNTRKALRKLLKAKQKNN